jgi:flagellar protein FliO/FliZ
MIDQIPLSRAVTQVAAVLGACLLAFACPAAAFTPTGGKASGENTPLTLSAPTTGSHSSTGSASIVRTIVGLAIVIAVIWGLTWILRQFKSGREGRSGIGAGGLASVSSLTLSSGRAVHLVRAGKDYVLVGSSEHGVVPIHRYSEQQARDAGLLASELPREDPREAPGFAEAGGPPAGWGHQTPMGLPPSTRSSNPIDRLREWTVRR